MKNKFCFQINLQLSLGGGEIFTRFFTRALVGLGYETALFVHADAPFWPSLLTRGTRIIPVRSLSEIEAQLASVVSDEGPVPVLAHSALPQDAAARFAGRAPLYGMLHMPLYERFPQGLRHYHRLFAVSEHVIASARSRGLVNVHPIPLYGVADLEPRAGRAFHAHGVGVIRAADVFDWDRRKVRDRLLGWIWSMGEGIRSPTRSKIFERRPGITLGIVSRITPIKQFPALFSILSPVIARFPAVKLEIFGSGGYASVRDLKRALKPISRQVRLWGQQDDVAAIYPQLDYVLSGLPEKEALGLNLIEAQCSDTPVLAVRAPPFTESVVDGATGFLFEDPRVDAGRGFGELLARLVAGHVRPQPKLSVEHLAKFSAEAFRERVALALDEAASASSSVAVVTSSD